MKVFVYGTLKVGGKFSVYVDKMREDVVPHTLHGYEMYSVSGMYPAIKEGDGAIYGEIHTLNEKALPILDRIEGYNANNKESSLYLRETIFVDGEEVYVYIFNDKKYLDGCEKVVEGVWEI